MLFLAKTILEDKIEVLSKSSIKLKVFENENKVVFKDNSHKKVAKRRKVTNKWESNWRSNHQGKRKGK